MFHTQFYRNFKKQHHAGLPEAKFGAKYLKICVTKYALWQARTTILRFAKHPNFTFSFSDVFGLHLKQNPDVSMAETFEKNQTFQIILNVFEFPNFVKKCTPEKEYETLLKILCKQGCSITIRSLPQVALLAFFQFFLKFFEQNKNTNTILQNKRWMRLRAHPTDNLWTTNLLKKVLSHLKREIIRDSIHFRHQHGFDLTIL